MDRVIKESLKEERSVDKECIHGKMEILIEDNFRPTTEVDSEYTSGDKEANTEDSGKTRE